MARSSTFRAGLLCSAAVAFMCASLQPSDAFAYAVKKTSRGENVRWRQTSVEYLADKGLEDSISGSHASIRTAMMSWSSLPYIPSMKLTPADNLKAGYDGKNSIVFAKDGYAPAGRALAITILSFDEGSGKILDADIVINGKYDFSLFVNGEATGVQQMMGSHSPSGDDVEDPKHDKSNKTYFDLAHVVGHELGHGLGLGDEQKETDAMMYAYTMANSLSRREPSNDDIKGLSELYPTAAGLQDPGAQAGGCGGASVSARGPGGYGTAAVAALALAAIAAYGWRRRARVVVPLAALGGLFVFEQGAVSAPVLTPSAFAQVRVVSTDAVQVDGLIKTRLTWATSSCYSDACPSEGVTEVWGGTVNGITQVVGEAQVPRTGEHIQARFNMERNTAHLGKLLAAQK